MTMDKRLQYMNIMLNAFSKTALGRKCILVHIFSQLLRNEEAEGKASD